MSRRWAVCFVCWQGFSARTAAQDVCCLKCLCHDPRHRIGYGMKALQAERKREQVRRAA